MSSPPTHYSFLRRLVQYGTKLLSWLLDEAALRPELVPLLHELEASISTARKCESCTVGLGGVSVGSFSMYVLALLLHHSLLLPYTSP